MVPIPEEYAVQTFYKCVSHAHFNKYTKTYNGSCPFCREGKSFGRKKRFYYLPEKELAFCHNCGYSKKVFSFILDVTGKTFAEVINEIKDSESKTYTNKLTEVSLPKPETATLPDDCINLSDGAQLQYYKDDEIVQKCLEYVKKRQLDTACNKPKTYYLSLTDVVHKNRLILPFYNLSGDIIHYQTRSFLDGDTKSKYLSKVHSEKSLCGIENVDTNKEHLFIFEGPIDSYFSKNSVAVLGINEGRGQNFTEQQKKQLGLFSSLKKVWVLDNQWLDQTSLKKTNSLIDSGESVFLWNREQKEKDFNEIAVKSGINEISAEFILNQTVSGLKAKVLMQFIH